MPLPTPTHSPTPEANQSFPTTWRDAFQPGVMAHVAVLNLDIVGSTQLGSIEVERTKRAINEALERVAEPHGASWVAGDSLRCWFKSPSEAVRVALHLDRNPSSRNGQRLRIGISEGGVVWSDSASEGSEDCQNLAGHLQKKCRPSQILVSRYAHDHLPRSQSNHFSFRQWLRHSGRLESATSNRPSRLHILALAASVVALLSTASYAAYANYTKPKHTIAVGPGTWEAYGKDEKRRIQSVPTSNPEINRQFSVIESSTYDHVIDSLGDDNCEGQEADIAMMSPYTFILLNARNKIPSHIKPVGFKKKDGLTTYTTHAIWNPDGCGIDKISRLSDLKSSKAPLIIALGDPYSTSSTRVPLAELTASEFVGYPIVYWRTDELISAFRNASSDRCVVGFVSDERLEGIESQLREENENSIIESFKLPIQIPFDVYLVNGVSCSHNSGAALHLLAKGDAVQEIARDERWEDFYSTFRSYIMAGVAHSGPIHPGATSVSGRSPKPQVWFNIPHGAIDASAMSLADPIHPRLNKTPKFELVRYDLSDSSSGMRTVCGPDGVTLTRYYGSGVGQLELTDSAAKKLCDYCRKSRRSEVRSTLDCRTSERAIPSDCLAGLRVQPFPQSQAGSTRLGGAPL